MFSRLVDEFLSGFSADPLREQQKNPTFAPHPDKDCEGWCLHGSDTDVTIAKA